MHRWKNRRQGGDAVEAGALLAELDSVLVDAEIKRLSVAQQLAESKVIRLAGLADKQVGARAALEDARKTFEMSKWDLALAVERKTMHALRAPFAGTILARTVDYSRFVEAGVPIFVLRERTAPWRAKIQVAGRHLPALAPGKPVELALVEYPDAALSSQVARIGASARADGLFDVDLVLHERIDILRAGLKVTYEFADGPLSKVYLIPIGHFPRLSRMTGDLYAMNESTQPPSARRISTEILFFRDGRAAVNPLDIPHKRIISQGIRHLRDGQTVRPLGTDQ